MTEITVCDHSRLANKSVVFFGASFNLSLADETLMGLASTYGSPLVSHPMTKLQTGENMNVCIVSTFKCTFDVIEAKIKEDMAAGASEFCPHYELIKVNDHKSIFMAQVTDFEAMGALMSSPEMQQWDEANGCVDTVYMLQPMG